MSNEKAGRGTRRVWTSSTVIAFLAGAVGALLGAIPAYLGLFSDNGSPPPAATSISVPRSATDLGITSPKNGQRVPLQVTVHGIARDVSPRLEIWIIVVPSGTLRYYPQEGPVLLQDDNTWTTPRVFLGRSNDVGLRFDLLAVTATKEGSGVLKDYLVKGMQTGDFPGLVELPKDVTEYDRITLVRR